MAVFLTHRAIHLSTLLLACGQPEECRGCSAIIPETKKWQGKENVNENASNAKCFEFGVQVCVCVKYNI